MRLPIVVASLTAIAIFGGFLATLNVQDDAVTYIPKNVLSLQTGETDRLVAEASFNCGKSLDEIQSQTPIDILTPKVLPEGYSLRNTDNAAPGRILLHYADGNVCGDNAKRLTDGVIEIVIAYPPNGAENKADGEAFLNYYEGKYEDGNIDYQTIVTENGLYMIAIEAGIGKSVTIDENDEIIHEDEFDYPARVRVFDKENGVGYMIKAFMPVEDLLNIAKSLS